MGVILSGSFKHAGRVVAPCSIKIGAQTIITALEPPVTAGIATEQLEQTVTVLGQWLGNIK